MSIFYGVACSLSLILLIVYFFVDKKREKWLMLLFISILICNAGYFMLSLSSSLTFALICNSIAYIGNIFLPFFMLMLILDVCNIKYSKILSYSLLIVGIIMLFIATSGGYLPIYYKSVSLEIIEGGSRLVKEYGILHHLYFVYLFSYMVSMVTIIIYSIVKKKITSKMHAIFLSVIVFGNILVWFIEQFVEHKFEFLCISYIINEGLLLLLYGMLREYEYLKTNNIKTDALSVDMSVLDLKNNFSKEQIALVFTNWQTLNILTNREKEILKHILLGERRKEIAVNLFISESAVRKHTTNIFRKLEVENRTELYDKAKKLI
ncbi:MAG: LuxR C-terminal-related transcriptional regulator [Christensenellales bacterium]